jgi:hypothetical protein
MKHIPVPAHVHYEVLLRILERQTFSAVEEHDYKNRSRMQDLINSLRKALSLQQQLEEDWQQRGLKVDYRWQAEEEK